MIDAKSFMEFFEKQYGTKFVDMKTGRNALDVINEQRTCANCKYILKGNGETLHMDDMVCGNPDSNYVTDFLMSDDICDNWELTKEEKG